MEVKIQCANSWIDVIYLHRSNMNDITLHRMQTEYVSIINK